MGAIILARIERLVFGSLDPKAGAALSLYNIGVDGKLNHRIRVKEGVLKDESAELLKRFFENIRRRKPNDV
jgi:tRNA(adenine34) deaminase